MRLLLSWLFLNTSVFLPFVSCSDCQVSNWTPWSECFGNCEVGLAVRNRDVLVPPLPSHGRRASFAPCPYLYETHPCKPAHCNEIEEMADMPTPGPLPMGEMENKHEDNTVVEKERRPLLARKWVSHPEKVYFGTKTLNGEYSRQTSSEENRSNEVARFTRPTPETTTLPRSNQPEYYINSLTLDLPMKNRITPAVEQRLKNKFHIEKIKYRNFEATTIEPELNEVFHHLERAAELNLPVDEQQIRAALKKNKKLVKALVEAYKARKGASKVVGTTIAMDTTTTATTTTESTTTTATESTTTATAEDTTISTASTATTTAPTYWPRTGYIPNSRKHASEITSKLYMTREIVQILHEDPLKKKQPEPKEDCLENNRCCKVEREVCSNGFEPVMVKRYYRPKGSSECIAYDYPRCSQGMEMEEQPIQFLQNCQDLCFSTAEKRISPLYILGQDF